MMLRASLGTSIGLVLLGVAAVASLSCGKRAAIVADAAAGGGGGGPGAGGAGAGGRDAAPPPNDACVCADLLPAPPDAVADLPSPQDHARVLAASIRVSRSTNSSEIDVVVYSDGSAERTLGPHNPAGTTSLDPPPKSYPPASLEVMTFLADLAGTGDISTLPVVSDCPKSVSFGTETTISAGGKTSVDMQCLANPTPDAMGLAADCVVLTGMR
jgi:hypothetical protein